MSFLGVPLLTDIIALGGGVPPTPEPLYPNKLYPVGLYANSLYP